MIPFTKPARLDVETDASGFDCGLPIANEWLHHKFKISEKQHTAVAYATFTNDHIAGFYTLSAYGLQRDSVKGWLSRNSPDPIPVILLGMLGVDIRYQTQHVGRQLLRDAIIRAANAAEIIGARALIVEPATDKAAGFYEKYGFRSLSTSAIMFLPLNC